MTSTSSGRRVLVVDDEPDIATVTRLSLRGLVHDGVPVRFADAATGAAAVADMAAHPETAVVLLDVVMETPSAGLDACRAIRDDLGNGLVRILLRTGQPGVAPERATIDDYDIDGYLAKGELTTTRLYSAVRTALRAHADLTELERHRRVLWAVNDSAASLRAFDPPEVTLQRVVASAVTLAPTTLAVLSLNTFEPGGDPRHWLLHVSPSGPDESAAAAAQQVAAAVAADPGASRPEPGPWGGGYLVPLVLARDLGEGWLYLDGPVDDPLARSALALLGVHAANALYASQAQAMLAAREGPFFDSLIV
ncbi:MAG: response regulator [Acidimicrobiales bacterium]